MHRSVLKDQTKDYLAFGNVPYVPEDWNKLRSAKIFCLCATGICCEFQGFSTVRSVEFRGFGMMRKNQFCLTGKTLQI